MTAQEKGALRAPQNTTAAPTAVAIEAAADLQARSYLRAAQAYMLISMPTGTSTIFGAFQAIRVSQVLTGRLSAMPRPAKT
jgi:hypothetical protein